MLGRWSSRGAAMCLAVLVLCLYWTKTDTFTLKNNINQKEATETVEPDGLKPGIIVLEGNNSASDTDYQADGNGGTYPDWRKYFPSEDSNVLCGQNQMYFSTYGKDLHHFGWNPMPPGCGYNVEGFPHRLTMTLPYQGCNMGTEGSYYYFPLYWQGNLVKLMCPYPNAAPTAAPFVPPWWMWYHYPKHSVYPYWYSGHYHPSHPYPHFHPWMHYMHMYQPPYYDPSKDPPTQTPPWYYGPYQHKCPLSESPSGQQVIKHVLPPPPPPPPEGPPEQTVKKPPPPDP